MIPSSARKPVGKAIAEALRLPAIALGPCLCVSRECGEQRQGGHGEVEDGRAGSATLEAVGKQLTDALYGSLAETPMWESFLRLARKAFACSHVSWLTAEAPSGFGTRVPTSGRRWYSNRLELYLKSLSCIGLSVGYDGTALPLGRLRTVRSFSLSNRSIFPEELPLGDGYQARTA